MLGSPVSVPLVPGSPVEGSLVGPCVVVGSLVGPCEVGSLVGVFEVAGSCVVGPSLVPSLPPGFVVLSSFGHML